MKSKEIVLTLLLLGMSCTAAATQLYGRQLCEEPGFTCKRVKDSQSWSVLFPDPHEKDIVMRINRMNTDIWGGMKIAVPTNLSTADIMDFSPLPTQIDAPGEKLIVIDPDEYAWGAYAADGALVRWGPISAGADYCRDIHAPCRTHQGSYRIFSLGSSDCISHKFPLPKGGAPMPYCMYFNNGQALHGEPNGLPGYNASHGCVRLFVNDAEWLRYDFVEPPNDSNRYRGTLIKVLPYAEPLVAEYDDEQEEG